MKVLNKTLVVISSVLVIYLAWISYLAIYQASSYLKDPLINEADKRSALSLKASLPTEYSEDGSLFWWVTTEGIELKYTNNLNERVVGKLIINFSGNPCMQEKVLDIKTIDNETISVSVIGDETIPITLKLDLEPYEETVIKVDSKSSIICTVDNGDNREFVARMNGWTFE